MKKSRMTVFALLVALVWATGCATTADVVRAKNDGTSQVYLIGSGQAWQIAKVVFRWEGSDSFEEHRAKGILVAKNGKEWMPWSSTKVAFVERLGRKHTKVTIVTKRRIGDVATNSSETSFHKRFAYAVRIVKAGGHLPPKSPI